MSGWLAALAAAFHHFLDVLGKLAGRLLGGAITLGREHLVEERSSDPLGNLGRYALQQREGLLLPCQSLRGRQEVVHRAIELSLSLLQVGLVIVGHAQDDIAEGARRKEPGAYGATIASAARACIRAFARRARFASETSSFSWMRS
jgi:hypothetical protein